MSGYYEKLGNLLNEALENGEIPQNTSISENATKSSSSSAEKTASEKETEKNNEKATFDRKNVHINSKIFSAKDKIPVGSVIKDSENSDFKIKMHNYAKIMHITPEIQSALSTLDIAYPYTMPELNKKYHTLLKLLHPDTNKNTIQNIQDVYKNRQLPEINQVQQAYDLLKNLIE